MEVSSAMTDTLYVFIFSIIIGYHVIWGVTPALHTPLMAVTNAISAIVVVGAMVVGGGLGGSAASTASTASATSTGMPLVLGFLGFAAIFLASINIFGGFVVTHRILAMFKKKK